MVLPLTLVLLVSLALSSSVPRTLAAPFRARTNAGSSMAPSKFLEEKTTTPYKEAFKARLRQEGSSVVCLFRVNTGHQAHRVKPGCISSKAIREDQIVRKRNHWSLFWSDKVQIDSWVCGDHTIDTHGTWFHISDLALNDADDWVVGVKPEERELVTNAILCHSAEINAPTSDSTIVDQEEDGSTAVEETERLSAHGDDSNSGSVSNTFAGTLRNDVSPSSCSVSFKNVCLRAKNLNIHAKEMWTASSTMHDVCGGVTSDNQSDEYKCCVTHFEAIVAIVISPCRDRGKNGEWSSPSQQTWNTMCAQEDYARLVGVDATHKPWMKPHYPPWEKTGSNPSPYTFAWEKESSDIAIINYYRPEFMGKGKQGDNTWLKLCPAGTQPCIQPYCPQGIQPCVESGWLHKNHHSNRGLDVWKDGGNADKWFDASPKLVRRKEIDGGKIVLESVEDSKSKMIRVHYCTFKRDPHTALRCLDHLFHHKVLTKNEKDEISLKFYNGLIIKSVRICKEREPKESSSEWKPIGSGQLDPGHPCSLSVGDKHRPDKACDTPVSEEFLNCFQEKMLSNHADRHKFKKASDDAKMNGRARELFDFVDQYDAKDDSTREWYKKTTDTYATEWYCSKGKVPEDECEEKKRRRRKRDDPMARKMRRSAFMSYSNLRRIFRGINAYTTSGVLQGEVMDILCWEDFVKVNACESDTSDPSSCIAANTYVDYFPLGKGLIQELAPYTWEIAHAKCEPTLGLLYAQILDISTMFPMSKSNLHVHVVMNRPPSKHSDCYVADQMQKCARQYEHNPDSCLCPDSRDYQGHKINGAVLNPDFINSKRALTSPQQLMGNKLYRTNIGIAILATIMNDWAATVTYPNSVTTQFLTPMDSANAEKLLTIAANGYLQRGNWKIKGAIDRMAGQLANDRYTSIFNHNNFLDSIEDKDSEGHNWGDYKRAFVAFRTANVYGGTRIGLEFRGGLDIAPNAVIKQFREIMVSDSGDNTIHSHIDDGDSFNDGGVPKDTSMWRVSEPWQHPTFIQQALMNLDEIGRKDLDAHIQVDVSNIVLRNMKLARYTINHGTQQRKATREKLEDRLLHAESPQDKDTIRKEIKDYEIVMEENKKQAVDIEKHRNEESTLHDAIVWIEKGQRVVSPNFFAYSENEPSFQQHCVSEKTPCVKWSAGSIHDNRFVLDQKREWFPRSMIDLTFKVIASEMKPSPQCSSLGVRNVAYLMRDAEDLALKWSEKYNLAENEAYNSLVQMYRYRYAVKEKAEEIAFRDVKSLCKSDTDSGKCTGHAKKACEIFCGIAKDTALIPAKDLYLQEDEKYGMDDKVFFKYLGQMQECINDLWTRWSFAFQSRAWENIFKKRDSPSSPLMSTKYRVKDFNRDLVQELVWDNIHIKKCFSQSKEEQMELKKLQATKRSEWSHDQMSKIKKIHGMEHRCWKLLMNGMGLPPNRRLSQHAL